MSLLTKIIEDGFVSSGDEEILSITEQRGFVIIVTDIAVYRIDEIEGQPYFNVRQIAQH